ncbi:hypothetical protein EZV62_005669 [Acer yangbiense]|uniref:CCHC-type domain-containing protein n=1 Tax=Acer yangbiense TaxID=1000413 RepID=A0A5C7IPD6_9ROSI|nr:hypothetical protein EZV62_005669 [Acer yangbiense]
MGTMEDPKAGEILEKSTEAQASASTSSISASTSSSWQRSSMSNAKFDIEKFDGTNNFGMWQCEVLDLLFREGSDIALNSKPKDISDEDWNYVNRQACGTIRLCLAKDQKYFVMKETMASSLWKKLEDKYMTKSIENRLYLKKKLFRFQYKKGISMIEHLDNYNKILADLQNLDVEIIDEDKALLLLNSLPDTYEHLTTTLLYGKDEVKFIDVSNALVNNEYRKKDQLDHRDSTSEALTVARGRTNNRRSGVPSERGRSRSKSRGPSHSKPKGESSFRRPAKDECAYCHQKGHWKKDCPNKDKSNVNVAITERAAVSSNSDDEASDTSRLWHMRLGHVGEKTLQGLVKQGRLKGAKTEALMYASHIVNRLPASALDGKTPKEVWSGQPVSDYDQLHIFGCPAYFHVTESKLDPRAKKAIFVGFSEGVKGFRLWNPESKKIILSRDVTFDESAMLKQIPRDTENENPNSLQQVEFETPKKSEKASSTVDHPDDEFDDQDEISVEVEDSAPVPEIRQQPESIATSRQKRDIRRPARYTDMVAYALPKYTRSHFDHCVYFCKLQDGTFVYLLLYVDDMLIASKSKVEIDRLKAQLSSEFDMKDLGEAKKILGMKIKRDRVKGTICLTQTQYLKTVLQRFGIDSKSKPLPLSRKQPSTPTGDGDFTSHSTKVYLRNFFCSGNYPFPITAEDVCNSYSSELLRKRTVVRSFIPVECLYGNTFDNVFGIAISTMGVVLFVVVIGQIQSYKRFVAARVERRKLMVQQYNCMLFRNLSENLQQQVKEYKGSIWKETKGVSAKGIDAVDFLCDLSKDLKRKIKRELCLESLKKVKEFGWWSEAMVDELCNCVKPVSYTEHTDIVMEGSSRRRTVINHLRDSDGFFGEELVAWFQADPYSSDLPISNKTVSVLTEAVGFALMSADLKRVWVSHFQILEHLAKGMKDPISDSKSKLAMLKEYCSGVVIKELDAGHYPHDERPEEVNSIIQKWIATVESKLLAESFL